MSDYETAFYELFKLTRDHEDAPPWALGLKLAEETGELSEVMLKELGFLEHKDKKFETPFEEAADVLNVVTGILATLYPEKTPEMLLVELLQAVNKKGKKYAVILGVGDEYFN